MITAGAGQKRGQKSVSVPLRGNVNNDGVLSTSTTSPLSVSVPLRGNVNNDYDVISLYELIQKLFPSPYGEM